MLQCPKCNEEGITDNWRCYEWPLKTACRICGARGRAVMKFKYNILAQVVAVTVLWSGFLLLMSKGLLLALFFKN